MNTEILMIILLGGATTLFSLGGTEIKKFKKGFKAIRRVGIPILFGVCLYFWPVDLWQAIVVPILTFGSLTMPYGDRTPWWKFQKVNGKVRVPKWVTACLYSVPSMMIGLTWWQMITPIIFLALFGLSNYKSTEKDFEWKIVESAIGFLLAANLIGALMRPY